jgi:hypothetical protein
MKITEAIMIIMGIIISNIALCQDTTKLVDRYYPKSETTTPEPQNKIAPLSRNEPSGNSSLQQKPVINNPIPESVVAQPTQTTANTSISDSVITAPVTETAVTQPTETPTAPANIINNPSPVKNTPEAGHIYQDTRLGSSSPQYNTYENNNYGAGAVTTDPNKRAGSVNMDMSNPVSKPGTVGPAYRDRLGSSSPQYNTYEKNNYGAGSVTTSPK